MIKLSWTMVIENNTFVPLNIARYFKRNQILVFKIKICPFSALCVDEIAVTYEKTYFIVFPIVDILSCFNPQFVKIKLIFQLMYRSLENIYIHKPQCLLHFFFFFFLVKFYCPPISRLLSISVRVFSLFPPSNNTIFPTDSVASVHRVFNFYGDSLRAGYWIFFLLTLFLFGLLKEQPFVIGPLLNYWASR